MSQYESGVCNIGATERRRRRWLGIAGIVGAAAYVGVVAYLEAPPEALLGTLAFLFPGLMGLLQDRASFCVGHALREQYDFRGSGGTQGAVRDKSAVPGDRLKAVKIVVGAGLGSLVLTATVYVVGLVVLV